MTFSKADTRDEWYGFDWTHDECGQTFMMMMETDVPIACPKCGKVVKTGMKP